MRAYNQRWASVVPPDLKLLDGWICQWDHPDYSPRKGGPDFVRLYFWKWSEPLTAAQWIAMIPKSTLLAATTKGSVVTVQIPGIGQWAVGANTEPTSLMVGDGTISFEVQAETPHATAELLPLARKVQQRLAVH